MGVRLWRPRLSARQRLLVVFALATLLVLGAAALGTQALLRTSLYDEAKQEAGREARLVADMGLATALSDGVLSRRDLRSAAAAGYAVAHADLPLRGLVVWAPSGVPVFSAGSGRLTAALHRLPLIASDALSTGSTRVAYASNPGAGATVEAAVPLGRRGLESVAEFYFSRQGVVTSLEAAKTRLYTLIGVAALFMYLAILPLLARLARRVPLPTDPARRAAAAEFRVALAQRQLRLHYQPKTEVATGRVVGVEALVRWEHPQRGLLGPAEFLPLAESSVELLAPLTCQVLDMAIRDCARWLKDGIELPLAVNLSTRIVLEGPLFDLLQEALSRHELPPTMLTLELTESSLIEHGVEVTAALAELRAQGISVSIDDFGTGHSSLARLRSLPLDELKLDRSFIATIATDERDLRIAHHIVELGNSLGLRVVAEGVEDATTLRLLAGIGCPYAQGFLFSKPVPEQQLRAWLVQHEHNVGVAPELIGTLTTAPAPAR